ncbi:tRNA (adenosine(37)-N6)-threonylcarbamoyltransferase complex dimerization subunit type 1 TsaB [Catenovulum sp. SM1970]|uniref:tRNA (adenosine(37)-N6)-threonylcarbamoyltransferase complex dimerization subunit type 1 TsaB n=1 Tax=Marinifaba aquimaris TaxID=2741323 RepID=UPI0015720C7C|nr:tRNA (adenosine(37)-N6)-threonylcarbamoyltransferase complex dimerization subunit type 1 TsaB [Marinifaba aquimaris]NTS78444.1 tRNA (adenosine(37)-N6)-threonylcarbamoyltransferase complex dimerization subunit type 1 TsaB [Marinifaba aquimaris]
MSKRILAIDTSTEACSVAVLTQDNVYSEFDICPREHNQRVLPMVDKLLAQAQLKLNQIDAIAVGAGPGSFTGVRIATGIVQGLAYGAKLPVAPVSSLAAMAHSAFRQEQSQNIICAIDARMSEIYLGAFQVSKLGQIQQVIGEAVTAPVGALGSLSTDTDWAGVGTGWQTYQSELSAQINAKVSEQVVFPHAIDIAYLAQANENAWVEAEKISPSYLRNEVTWKKLPGKG